MSQQHLPIPVDRARLTAGEYRKLMLQYRRWMHVCLDAGEITQAKRLLDEAARFGRLADEIENERKAA